MTTGWLLLLLLLLVVSSQRVDGQPTTYDDDDDDDETCGGDGELLNRILDNQQQLLQLQQTITSRLGESLLPNGEHFLCLRHFVSEDVRAHYYSRFIIIKPRFHPTQQTLRTQRRN